MIFKIKKSELEKIRKTPMVTYRKAVKHHNKGIKYLVSFIETIKKINKRR